MNFRIFEENRRDLTSSLPIDRKPKRAIAAHAAVTFSRVPFPSAREYGLRCGL